MFPVLLFLILKLGARAMNLSPQEITAEIFTLQEEDRRQISDFMEFVKKNKRDNKPNVYYL